MYMYNVIVLIMSCIYSITPSGRAAAAAALGDSNIILILKLRGWNSHVHREFQDILVNRS